jgi:hypothetical protein
MREVLNELRRIVPTTGLADLEPPSALVSVPLLPTPMPDDDRYRLLYGPYCPPPLQRGDRAFCI